MCVGEGVGVGAGGGGGGDLSLSYLQNYNSIHSIPECACMFMFMYAAEKGGINQTLASSVI